MNPLSVCELNEQIKSLIETTFLSICVKGEISRITHHTSGHVYFTLKDEKSSIDCVLFKSNAQKMKFKLEQSLSIIIYGQISLYLAQGKYQILCQNIEPDGSGALALAYEQLKNKLELKGYFNQSNKKQIPKFPKHLGIISSKTGAALQDMLSVTKKRFPMIKITLINTLVQGENAKFTISQALKQADLLNCDVLILARGGGNIEDLWCFNEELVADTIFSLKTPIVSAIGHEIDYVLSDFVADLRAPTPSAAIELVLPDINELKQNVDELILYLNKILTQKLNQKQLELNSLLTQIKQNDFLLKIKLKLQEIKILKNSFKSIFQTKTQAFYQNIDSNLFKLQNSLKQKLSQKQNELEKLNFALLNANPELKIQDGYAMIVLNNKKTNLNSLKPNDIIELQTTTCKQKAKIL